MYMYMYIYIYIYMYTYICICICICICIYICMYIYTHIRVYICIRMCMRVCTCIYVVHTSYKAHTHAYTHTHVRTNIYRQNAHGKDPGSIVSMLQSQIFAIEGQVAGMDLFAMTENKKIVCSGDSNLPETNYTFKCNSSTGRVGVSSLGWDSIHDSMIVKVVGGMNFWLFYTETSLTRHDSISVSYDDHPWVCRCTDNSSNLRLSVVFVGWQ